MSITLYGIKSCDTVKKARAWLDKRGVDYKFHDYRAEGLERATLEAWSRKAGWEKLLNRASTTFRELPAGDREGVTEKKAVALMLKHPTVIKRPVLDIDGAIQVGFKPEFYDSALS